MIGNFQTAHNDVSGGRSSYILTMAAYTVVPGLSGGFAVEIQSEGKVELIDGFKTEKEAQDWMLKQQRTDDQTDDPC